MALTFPPERKLWPAGVVRKNPDFFREPILSVTPGRTEIRPSEVPP